MERRGGWGDRGLCVLFFLFFWRGELGMDWRMGEEGCGGFVGACW